MNSPSPPLPRRPTRVELAAAAGKTVPDVIAAGLKVLFCGINPGLYTAAVGHHFARPGNRFWQALADGGFTDRLLSPHEEHELLKIGCGITNVVDRATAAADELTDEDYRRGGAALERKVRRFRPGVLAVLGVGAYRKAFDRPHAAVGLQEPTMGSSRIWVLPNPSGLNAHYNRRDFGELFHQLREAAFLSQ